VPNVGAAGTDPDDFRNRLAAITERLRARGMVIDLEGVDGVSGAGAVVPAVETAGSPNGPPGGTLSDDDRNRLAALAEGLRARRLARESGSDHGTADSGSTGGKLETAA